MKNEIKTRNRQSSEDSRNEIVSLRSAAKANGETKFGVKSKIVKKSSTLNDEPKSTKRKKFNTLIKKSKVNLRSRVCNGRSSSTEVAVQLEDRVKRKKRQIPQKDGLKFSDDSDGTTVEEEKKIVVKQPNVIKRPQDILLAQLNNDSLKSLNEFSKYFKHYDYFRSFLIFYRRLRTAELNSPSFFNKSLSYVHSNRKEPPAKIKEEVSFKENTLLDELKNYKLKESDSDDWTIVIEPLKLDPLGSFQHAILDFFLVRKFVGKNDSDSLESQRDLKMFFGTHRINFTKENFYKKITISASSLLQKCDEELFNVNDFKYYFATIVTYCKGDLVLLDLGKGSDSSQHQFMSEIEIHDLFYMNSEASHKMEFTIKLTSVEEHKAYIKTGANIQNIITPCYEWVPITDDDIFYPQASLNLDLLFYNNFCLAENFLDSIESRRLNFTFNATYSRKSKCPAGADYLKGAKKQPLKTRNFWKNGAIDDFDLDDIQSSESKTSKCKVVYHFKKIQNNIITKDYICPICQVDCEVFPNLAIHLNYSHSRFKFKIQKDMESGLYKVGISINEKYDTSIEKNPWNNSHLCHSKPGGINRRVFHSEMLIFNPNKKTNDVISYKPNDSCMLINVKDFDACQARKKIFYHSQTCVPVLAAELDQDSENEDYPPWLKERKESLIDEFIDVNAGEKCLIKMWNNHINTSRKTVIGDRHIPEACMTFVEKYGGQLVKLRLKNNFLFHLINLHHFTLLPGEMIVTLMDRLKQIEAEFLVRSKKSTKL